MSGCVWLSRSAAAEMSQQATDRALLETGGLLLGHVAADGPDVVVLDVLGPGPGARHAADSFEPDHVWQTQELAARYRASDGLLGYLGDWHSHPSGTAVPSRQDLRTLARIASFPPAGLPKPLMLILATDEGDGHLAAWRWAPVTFGRLVVRARASHVPIRLF